VKGVAAANRTTSFHAGEVAMKRDLGPAKPS